MLCSFEHKVKLIQEFGIDEVIWTPFNYEVARVEAEEFIHLLVNELNAVHIVCGFNFRFGHKGRGNVELLKEYGEKLGFAVTVVPAVALGEQTISSTRIREMIAEGRVDEAAHLLGRYPSYRGTVVVGEGRGRQLGFPTANLEIDPRIVLPGEGVYFTWAVLSDGLGYPAMTSVGKNPTFAGDRQTIEAYIMNYSGDLYNQSIELQFLKKTREIIRFETAQELKDQIAVDVELANELMKRFHLHGNRIVLQ